MEHTQVAVVGGGVAGTSAARAAAELGLDVVLIDEHPVDDESMAMDIPLFFGQRPLGTASDRGLMMSRVIAANPGLQSVAEAGAKVHAGVVVWDSAANNTLTLADEERSWRVRYDRAIFASGARDLCLPFRGWDKAGVMGAAAALTLIDRYQAFAGGRIAVIGSGGLARTLVESARHAGVEVAGIVDIAPIASIDFGDVPLFPNHGVIEAIGDPQVEGLAIAELDASGVPAASSRTEIECDTVCFAIGLVSNIDVMYWTGCDLEFRPGAGELTPVVDSDMRTSRAGMFAVGDCAGVTPDSFASPELAQAQGRVAASAAARDLGVAVDAPPSTSELLHDNGGIEVRRSWARALSGGASDLLACLCEEVTRADIAGTVEAGPRTPDHVKRLTRGGMGHCQGRRCREGIQALMSELTGTPLENVAPASYRPPFRPVSLEVVRNRDLTHEEEEFVKIRWHRRKPTTGGMSVEAS